MAKVLAVDIGGTKTLFQLTDEWGEEQFKLKLNSQDYATFDEILTVFLDHCDIKGKSIAVASFAVAGPVKGKQARVTKLPWVLDVKELRSLFGFPKIILSNDFEAVGHGIACLREEDIHTLHEGEPTEQPANRAVIGAGTGLGQAILIPQKNNWQVIPTEGGHVDFGPTDRTQQRLLEHLHERFGHVSYDRIVCGSGLEILYHFLRDYKQIDENENLRLAMMNEDPAAAISRFAAEFKDDLASQTMKKFFKIYGAQAGNLALTCFARGGVYLAGGIGAKNLDLLKQSQFVEAFLNKGRMQHLVEMVPVHVVLDPEVGLKGARLLAQKALYN